MTDPKPKSTGGAKDPDEITKPANAAPGSTEQASQTAGATGGEQESDKYVLTINRTTGDVLKIERVDDSGKKEELSEEEYQTIFGDPTQAVSASGAEDPYVQAYYQGVADAQSYTAMEGYSPEELAYYQALSDYDSYLNAGWLGDTSAGMGFGYEGYSPEELAYYQGIEDYQASLG